MKNNVSRGRIGFSDILLVVFIVLKLVGTIDWSWWWVLSPLWISVIMWLIIYVCCEAYVAREESEFTKRRKDKWKF